MGELTLGLLADLQKVFDTTEPVVIYASSGTGAWEAAIANTLSAGDVVLSVSVGHFATLWAGVARAFGIEVQVIDTDWRHPADPAAVEAALRADTSQRIKGVFITHNETSTGVTSDISAIRAAIDRADHPALLYVDAVSSLGSVEYHHDAWGVDVTVAASQKGLMLPPGLAFNAVSQKARAAAERATLPCAYWKWDPIIAANEAGYFPWTPATNMFFALRAALDLIETEGLPAIWERHRRHAEATRAAVGAWGLELQCLDPSAYSSTLTAIVMPEGYRETDLRAAILDSYAMALGTGLGRIAGTVFRIGHLGDFDDLSLVATLAGVELGLAQAKIPHTPGGVAAALERLGSG